jgi:hypothetical protein
MTIFGRSIPMNSPWFGAVSWPIVTYVGAHSGSAFLMICGAFWSGIALDRAMATLKTAE